MASSTVLPMVADGWADEAALRLAGMVKSLLKNPC